MTLPGYLSLCSATTLSIPSVLNLSTREQRFFSVRRNGHLMCAVSGPLDGHSAALQAAVRRIPDVLYLNPAPSTYRDRIFFQISTRCWYNSDSISADPTCQSDPNESFDLFSARFLRVGFRHCCGDAVGSGCCGDCKDRKFIFQKERALIGLREKEHARQGGHNPVAKCRDQPSRGEQEQVACCATTKGRFVLTLGSRAFDTQSGGAAIIPCCSNYPSVLFAPFGRAGAPVDRPGDRIEDGRRSARSAFVGCHGDRPADR